MAKRKKAAGPAFAKYTVTHYWGQNLRSGPGLEFPVLRTIPQGATVEAAEADGTWVHVEEGWMDSQLMRKE